MTLDEPVAARWSQAELASRIHRALDFAEAALRLLSSEEHQLDLKALEAPQDKVIAESAMFLRAVIALPEELAPYAAARARAIARALLPWARHARVRVSLLLFPALALDYAAAHLNLARAGFPDPEFDRLLNVALAAPTAQARERLPHRELEQLWLRQMLESPDTPDMQGAEAQAILGRTLLRRTPDLISSSRDDLYGLTHALLYATDFGQQPLQVQTALNLTGLAASALCGPLDDDDFDLAGELLLTWPFLNAPWPPTARFAFRVLTRLEDEVGVVPSLSLDGAGYQGTPTADRGHYLTATSYHTAFVMGLLCTATLKQVGRQETNTSAPAAPGPRELIELCLEHLSAATKRPQWLHDFLALPDSEQRACWSFLLDVTVRRAVHHLEFAQARELLARSLAWNLPASPLCAQTAGLLRRIGHLQS